MSFTDYLEIPEGGEAMPLNKAARDNYDPLFRNFFITSGLADRLLKQAADNGRCFKPDSVNFNVEKNGFIFTATEKSAKDNDPYPRYSYFETVVRHPDGDYIKGFLGNIELSQSEAYSLEQVMTASKQRLQARLSIAP